MSDDLGIPEKFLFFPNSRRLSLRFQRSTSFLISVTNQMRLYRPHDVSTPV